MLGLDLNQTSDLTTAIAQCGTIRTAEAVGDDVFDYIVAIAFNVQPSLAGAAG